MMTDQPTNSVAGRDHLQLFQEVRETLAHNSHRPTKAWQSLSKALSKHSSSGCYSEPWTWAIPSKLPWVMANCITLILKDYKYHQESRRKDLCQLSQLTAQLYVQCDQQQDTSVRVSLAKQANDSELLLALPSRLLELCQQLVSAEQYVSASAAVAGAAVVEHGKPKSSNNARDALDGLAANLELAHAYMQLVNAISSIWPGQAGLLSSRVGAFLMGCADAAAGVVVTTAAMAVDHKLVSDAFGEQCVSHAVHAMVQRAQRINSSKLSSVLVETDALQAFNLSTLLERALLLWGLKLESATAAADRCQICASSTSISDHIRSSSDSSGTVPTSATADTSSSNYSSSNHIKGVATANPAAACPRCSRVLLLSMLRPGAGSIRMSDHLWQVAAQAAAEHMSSTQRHLELMQVLLQQLEERMKADLRSPDHSIGAVDALTNRKLAPLIITLLDTACCCFRDGQRQQAAAAAIAAAESAASAWQSGSLRRGIVIIPPAVEPEGAYGPYETDNMAEYVSLVTQLLQHVLQLHSDKISNELGSASSSSSTCCWRSTVKALLSVLADTMAAVNHLSDRDSNAAVPWFQELQPAVAAVEASLRTVSPTAAMAASDEYTQQLATVLESLLAAGNMGWCRMGGKNTGGNPAAAATGRNSRAGHQLFALLVSSLKVTVIASTSGLATGAARPATACTRSLIDCMDKGSQPPSAALLSAAMPWLVVLARVQLAVAAWVTAEASKYIQEQAAAAAAAATACSSTAAVEDSSRDVYVEERDCGPPEYNDILNQWHRMMSVAHGSMTDLCDSRRLCTPGEQPNRLNNAAANAANLAAAATAAAVVQPHVEQLLQQWERQLLPQLKQAELLFRYFTNMWAAAEPGVCSYLNEMTAIATEAAAAAEDAPAEDVAAQASTHNTAGAVAAAVDLAKQAAAITGSSAGQVWRDRMLLIANSPFMQQLQQQLEAAGNELCALLPLPLCCNNPGCVNLSRQSELQLVGGKVCVCARCEVARYCGQKCQAAHWKAHKRVCKMIKKSRAAAV